MMIKKNKKAISAIVGEVLLIVLAIVMAGLVYSWLKFYVQNPVPKESCPAGVSLNVDDYVCAGDFINITLNNRGRFPVNGFIARISNSSQEIAIYLLAETAPDVFGEYSIETTRISFNPELNPGEINIKSLNYSKYNQITFLEVEPAKGVDKVGNWILCDNAIVKLPVEGCN
jgi:hypothetical protein